jgi:hypothetical protein
MGIIADRLQALATCLCAQIAADELPEPCFCGVLPGEAVAGDYAGNCQTKCGMAWVRLVNIYPAKAIGQPDITPGNCGAGLGFEVEVGIVRCVPVGNAAGMPPTAAQMLAATELQIADSMAMFKALQCCAPDSRDMIVGSYEPTGPEGGLVGGTLLVQFAI